MSPTIILDTGPLGLVTNPRYSPQNEACLKWLQSLSIARIPIILLEIVDYERRRELLRANKTKGLMRLDQLGKMVQYLPITTIAMRQAASLWAQARQKGKPTAGDHTIDADMILIGQIKTLNIPNVIIATTNIGHLNQFVPADLWINLTAEHIRRLHD